MASRTKLSICLLLVAASLTIIVPQSARSKDHKSGSKSLERHLANATAQFGLNFLNHLDSFKGNKSASETELNKVLGYDHSNQLEGDGAHKASHSLTKSLNALAKDTSDDKLNLKMANLMISESDRVKLQHDYEKALKSYYDVKLETFSQKQHNWAAELEKRINSWVKKMTNNQIDKLFSEEELKGVDTAIVLLNAAHFKAQWLNKFEAKQTTNDDFHHGSGDAKSQAKFMHKRIDASYVNLNASSSDCKGKDSKEAECKLHCRVLSLPFLPNKGSELSMVFLLPHKRDGIADLQAKLDGSTLDQVYKALEKHEVDVKLPKFTFDSSISAREIFEKMGIKEIFSHRANFKRMVGGKNDIHVERVHHKAKVIVDESGAEAAAATGVQFTFKSLRMGGPHFHASHPFLFIIRHNKSHMPLFMGRVSRP